MKLARSTRLEILRRLLAAVADHVIVEHLALVERRQAGPLYCGDVNEYVSAAVLRRNESKPFRRVNPFNVPLTIMGLPWLPRIECRTTNVPIVIGSNRAQWKTT